MSDSAYIGTLRGALWMVFLDAFPSLTEPTVRLLRDALVAAGLLQETEPPPSVFRLDDKTEPYYSVTQEQLQDIAEMVEEVLDEPEFDLTEPTVWIPVVVGRLFRMHATTNGLIQLYLQAQLNFQQRLELGRGMPVVVEYPALGGMLKVTIQMTTT